MAYYDALLELFGAKRFYETERGVGWGITPDQPMFAVNIPFDSAPATGGNGSMVALSASSQEQVQTLYAKALKRVRCTELGHRMNCCLQLCLCVLPD
jgi:hypothetical protein